MKKLLLSLFAVFFALNVYAQTVVTFNFDDDATELFGISGRSSNDSNEGDITEDAVAVVDGVVLTVSPAEEGNSTPNRLWTSSPVLRMYSGTISIEANDVNITKVEFVATKFTLVATTGVLDGKVWTADADVSEIVFTVEKNTQLKSLTVTLDGEIGGNDPVELPGTGEGTQDAPYDVERALSIIDKGDQTNDKVYVSGTISKINEINLEYGNATYYISNGQMDIMVFRGSALNGDKFVEDDEIAVGDVVVLYGVLTDFNGTPEITKSSIVSINGESGPVEPEYVPVGDGSEENPYTVTDIQKLKIEESNGEYYWVKGYILGSCASASKLNEPDAAVDTNLALGESAAASSFIPVALVGEARTIGVASNPSNVGKEIMVRGTLEKYFGVPGVKNVKEYIGTNLSGVQALNADNAPVRYYNLQGVEVANPVVGGLYIQVQGNKASKVIK